MVTGPGHHNSAGGKDGGIQYYIEYLSIHSMEGIEGRANELPGMEQHENLDSSVQYFSLRNKRDFLVSCHHFPGSFKLDRGAKI